MRKTCIFMTTLLFLFSASSLSYAITAAFEAELGKIEAPMEIGKDAKASGGNFVQVPEGKGNAPNATAEIKKGNQAWIDIEFQLPADGTFYLWGRTISPDGGADSFFVTFDPTKADDRGVWNGGNENVWDTTESPDWIWDIVAGKLGRGTPQRSFKLSKGKHVLRIWHREDGTKLDAIFMSDNSKATPRLPTPDDIKIQQGAGIAVEPAGKLATTWGGIKLMRR